MSTTLMENIQDLVTSLHTQEVAKTLPRNWKKPCRRL